MNHPIEEIKWIRADELSPNQYNPNVVFNQELQLLAHSIIKNGWIQPVLVSQDYIIIDGFHRYWLVLNDDKVSALTNFRCPCAVMDLTETERILLTVRINRAKGSHVAAKMHELVQMLVTDYALSATQIAKEIGATKAEVDLLLMDNVFKKLDIENHNYSKAWYPLSRKDRNKLKEHK